jgi:hypothetical protein
VCSSDLRKFLAENKLTSTSKNINENSFKDYADAQALKKREKEAKEKETKKPISEMNGGYIEVMGDEFDEATDVLAQVWERWKNGPATEEEDIEPAKADILQYIKAVILK